MKKIAITGHLTSKYIDLKNLLIENGVSSASFSKKEKLSVHEIQKILLKENVVSCFNEDLRLEQIKPTGVWSELVLDFLLGNVETNEPWCWASTESIQLSEMWLSADNNINFIVVYNHPVDALIYALANDESKSLTEVLHDWYKYYNTALTFKLENSERCLLIQDERAMSWPLVLNEILGEKLANFNQGLKNFTENAEETKDKGLGAIVDSLESEKLLNSSTLKWIFNDFIKDDKSLVLYEQLVASDDALEKKHTEPKLKKEVVWNEIRKHVKNTRHNEQAVKEMTLNYNAIYERGEIERKRSGLMLNQLEKLQIENEGIKKAKSSISSLQEKKNEKELIRLKDENCLLLTQLELTQSVLNKDEVVKVQKKKVKVPMYGAGDRIKKQLTYRLGAVVVQSDSIMDHLLIPFRLRNEHRAFKNEQKNKVKLPPISLYLDAHEAEKVKRHLSYRLGLLIMRESQSIPGLMALPFKLTKEVKKFHKEKTINNKNSKH